MSTGDFHKRETLVDFPGEEKQMPLPKMVGGYKVESLLAKGGMSLLYLGLEPETLEPIAIKVLSAKYVSNPQMVDRFLKEAEIIELTNHPNIVRLFGHGKWEGGVYIAMEFVQGISLRQMILQEAMSLKRALEVVMQISHALTHLHAHGIIHRDLKPENILLTAQGGVKVIDFGISQIYTEKGDSRLLGTPVYMSPEQRENPLNVSFASDIFSLGIITYELVLGRLSHGVVHLSVMPRGLQKILGKALQPKVEDRYEDIVDFIKELSSYMGSDELIRDMRGSDYLSELGERLKEAQTFLIPKDLPTWPRVEMAMASNCNSAISTVYYDFFRSKDHVLSIVMGESLKTDVEGLLKVSMLKGMVRALADSIEDPVSFIANLNARVRSEEAGETFSFSLLTLFPADSKFSYISCGYSPIWHLPRGADRPRRLTSDNPLLGSGEMDGPIEVSSNWTIGDALILHTFQAGSAKGVLEFEANESTFLEALMENLYLAPQKQVDVIFRKIVQREGKALYEKPITVISIERIS